MHTFVLHILRIVLKVSYCMLYLFYNFVCKISIICVHNFSWENIGSIISSFISWHPQTKSSPIHIIGQIYHMMNFNKKRLLLMLPFKLWRGNMKLLFLGYIEEKNIKRYILNFIFILEMYLSNSQSPDFHISKVIPGQAHTSLPFGQSRTD